MLVQLGEYQVGVWFVPTMSLKGSVDSSTMGLKIDFGNMEPAPIGSSAFISVKLNHVETTFACRVIAKLRCGRLTILPQRSALLFFM